MRSLPQGNSGTCKASCPPKALIPSLLSLTAAVSAGHFCGIPYVPTHCCLPAWLCQGLYQLHMELPFSSHLPHLIAPENPALPPCQGETRWS